MATGDSVQLQAIAKPKNSPTTKRRTLEQQQQLWGWLFLSPWIVGFLAFTAFPIVFSFGLTFTDYTLANPDAARFIGLSNWQKLFTDPLARFRQRMSKQGKRAEEATMISLTICRKQ
jgi:multiple sugar transport system permease protein